MPTYDYTCTVCNHSFEEFHGINEKTTRKCPKCGKKAKRMISVPAAIHFKGSGFYETDYKQKERGMKPYGDGSK